MDVPRALHSVELPWGGVLDGLSVPSHLHAYAPAAYELYEELDRAQRQLEDEVARAAVGEAPPLPTTHLWLLPPHKKTTISKIHVGAETHFLQTMASKGLTFCAALPACTDSRELYALFTHPP